jgi:hypothetical protein
MPMTPDDIQLLLARRAPGTVVPRDLQLALQTNFMGRGDAAQQPDTPRIQAAAFIGRADGEAPITTRAQSGRRRLLQADQSDGVVVQRSILAALPLERPLRGMPCLARDLVRAEALLQCGGDEGGAQRVSAVAHCVEAGGEGGPDDGVLDDLSADGGGCHLESTRRWRWGRKTGIRFGRRRQDGSGSDQYVESCASSTLFAQTCTSASNVASSFVAATRGRVDGTVSVS